MTTNANAPRRLFIFARHGESAANVARVVSSDPAHGAGLTPRGRAQARRLGAPPANLEIDLALCPRDPAGESVDKAVRRYADGLQRVLAREEASAGPRGGSTRRLRQPRSSAPGRPDRLAEGLILERVSSDDRPGPGEPSSPDDGDSRRAPPARERTRSAVGATGRAVDRRTRRIPESPRSDEVRSPCAGLASPASIAGRQTRPLDRHGKGQRCHRLPPTNAAG
jgi:hypothetical protein